MIDVQVDVLVSQLRRWGHDAQADDLKELGQAAIDTGKLPLLKIAIEHADALTRGTALELGATRHQLDEWDLVDHRDEPPSTADDAAFRAAAWLGFDPMEAAEMSLAWLHRSGSDRPDLTVSLATTAALALQYLGLHGAAQRLAREGAEIGLGLLAGEANLANQAVIAYRCATAVDLLIHQAGDDYQAVASLIEAARRTALPARPADLEQRRAANTVSDGPAEPPVMWATAGGDRTTSALFTADDLDLLALARAATGATSPCWWGIRVSEGAAWVSTVGPTGRATVDFLPAEVTTPIVEQVDRQLPVATTDELYSPLEEVEDRYARSLLGRQGMAPASVEVLVPTRLRDVDPLARQPVDVAVSLPAVLHHVPLAAIPLGGRRLINYLRPTIVGPRARPLRPDGTVNNPTVGHAQGPDSVELMRRLRPELPLAATSLEDAKAVLQNAAVDIAVMAGHISHRRGDHALGAVDEAATIATNGLCFRGGELTPDLVAELDRVPWCVVLVGCRGTGGTVTMSDDRVGLAPALLRAGARWVISSSWPVPIASSRPFIQVLLDQLEHQTPPEALRRAQLTFADLLDSGQGPEVATNTWLPWTCMAACP